MAYMSHPGSVKVSTLFGWSGTFEPGVVINVPDLCVPDCRAVGCVETDEPPVEAVAEDSEPSKTKAKK